MKIERFEELVAWQKARSLTAGIYQMTQQGAFAKDFGLSNQIQRAIVSVMSNIAEGFERGSRGEFHQFLSIANRPARNYVPSCMSLLTLATSTNNMLIAR